MADMMRSFFINLYSADSQVKPEALLQLFTPQISEENSVLCKDFSDNEISDAMFQIGPLKAQGQMGSRLDFFKEIGIFLKVMLLRVFGVFFKLTECLKVSMIRLLF
jgi:hypothetical protein